ncbi:helix-turn-helix transcriptional regulator [Stutzerimonas stutzeri]|uniref:helix-turn-helix transcriptional regulator n=1 Tax=Stutzerimonas stutzeri TaxID=316 RepID=UPI003013EA4D
MAFGCVLRKLRKQKRLSQEKLAFEAGLDRTTISLLELGKRSPTLDTIMTLCAVLDIQLVDMAVEMLIALKENNTGHDTQGSA